MRFGSTVPVSSRIRSASVDLPWSMWAMIEKLRMRSIATAEYGDRALRLARAARPAHEPQDLLQLGHAERGESAEVDGGARDEPGADRRDLTRQPAAQRVVEDVPDGVRHAGEDRRGDRYPRRRGDQPRDLEPAEHAAQDDRLGRDAGRGR